MDAKLRREFGFRLVGLSRRWRQHVDEGVAAVGLSDATWSPLFHLHRIGDGLTQKELAARIGLDGSSLVRLIDILERQGLVERRTETEDRRAKRLYLTFAGAERVSAILERLLPIENEMLQDLDDAEIAVLLGAFQKIEARIGAARESGEH
ncbi:MarR family transcriptional regulator [Rhizobium daejeonense]|uniref:MarR family transcriptional regulator n=1 Tax=Rhizobium daejeonense TaxID=240521 RepID=A0A6M1RYS4_9HYPH|nr:MarR family transcriptional regulator [Rhizobium daejeonense]